MSRCCTKDQHQIPAARGGQQCRAAAAPCGVSVVAHMTMAGIASPFSEHAVELIKASLPGGIDQRRLDLLPLILNEWSRTDLREHLSRDTPAASRKRFAQLTKVGKCATHLRQALEALDQRGWVWIAQEIGREDGSPLWSVTREGLSEMKERLKQQDDFLKRIEAAIPRLLEEDKQESGHPRNIRAYLVVMDLVAIFEWLTGRKATREVDRDLGKDTGPFWDFAAAVWPHVFGQGGYGLSAAMKNWKKWHSLYGEESPFIRNMAMRHPEMADI